MPIEPVWENPPGNRATRSQFDEPLKLIKERPGTWARLKLYANQGPAYKARQRLLLREVDKRWEVKVSRLNGKWGLYARYRTDKQMEE